MTVAEQKGHAAVSPPPRRMAIDYELIGPTVTTLDCIFLVTICPLATMARTWLSEGQSESFWRAAAISAVVCGLVVPLFSLCGLYDPRRLRDFSIQFKTIVAVCALASVLLMFAAMQLDFTQELSRSAAVEFVSVVGILTLHHLFWSHRLRQGLQSAGVRPCEIAVITVDGGVTPDQRARLEALGYDIRLQIDVASFTQDEKAGATATALRGAAIDEVILAVPFEKFEPALLDALATTPLPVRFLPDQMLTPLGANPARSDDATILFDMRSGPLADHQRRLKRLLDLVVALVVIVLATPFLLLIAAIIYLESPGPVLFRQTRLGFNGAPFKIFKFRSMTVTEDGPVVTAATRGDARVTRVGRFIRRFSIDELPQLFNVLRGEMSLVGPRPHALAHDQAFDGAIAKYAHRQHVKPGLTGWAQINGHRGSIDDPSDMARRLEYDLWYINNWRISLDLKILLMTAVVVFFTRKAF